MTAFDYTKVTVVMLDESDDMGACHVAIWDEVGMVGQGTSPFYAVRNLCVSVEMNALHQPNLYEWYNGRLDHGLDARPAVPFIIDNEDLDKVRLAFGDLVQRISGADTPPPVTLVRKDSSDATCPSCNRRLATTIDDGMHNTGECGCEEARSICWRRWNNGTCLPLSLYDPKTAFIREGFARLRGLIDDMKQGKPPEVTPEQRALAAKALASIKAREGEDIDAWAERLAEDMVRAGEIESAPACPLCPHATDQHYYDDGAGTVPPSHNETRLCLGAVGSPCDCSVPAGTGCPTCYEPYSKVLSARAWLCSNPFHSCRDCVWHEGAVTTPCSRHAE